MTDEHNFLMGMIDAMLHLTPELLTDPNYLKRYQELLTDPNYLEGYRSGVQDIESYHKSKHHFRLELFKQRMEKFIGLGRKAYGSHYDYSKVGDAFISWSDRSIIDSGDLVNRRDVAITCHRHGDFKVVFPSFCGKDVDLVHEGCPDCGYEERDMVDFHICKQQFIELAKKVYGDKYDYSKIVYTGYRFRWCKKITKITITCRIHGDFEQTPNYHLKGYGCPACNQSRGENKVNQHLKSLKPTYLKSQQTFDDCRDKGVLKFDFGASINYGPLFCVEFNGGQHYGPVEYFGGQKGYKAQKRRDKIKKDYCDKNNIPLLVIHHEDYDNIETLIDDFIANKVSSGIELEYKYKKINWTVPAKSLKLKPRANVEQLNALVKKIREQTVLS